VRHDVCEAACDADLSATADGCACCTEKHVGVLSDLVHELVELAQSGDDDSRGGDVAMEAACCLGVIGIIDIGLVSCRGRPANVELESALSAQRDSAKMLQYCHMFHTLADCLTDSQLVPLLLYAVMFYAPSFF